MTSEPVLDELNLRVLVNSTESSVLYIVEYSSGEELRGNMTKGIRAQTRELMGSIKGSSIDTHGMISLIKYYCVAFLEDDGKSRIEVNCGL